MANKLTGLTSNVQEQLNARVVAPASAIDGHLAVFDTTTGKLLKDGGAISEGGGGTGVVTKDKIGQYWTGCTIVTANCTSVDWQATGVCVLV